MIKASSFPTRFRRQSWNRFHHSRSPKHLKALATAVLLLGAYHLVSTIQLHRQALRVKFSPTIYNHLLEGDEIVMGNITWRWDGKSKAPGVSPRYSRDQIWAHRNEWTKLGSGSEGETLRYNDTVIKVYHETRFPFRNCVPAINDSIRWPTEIPASLILGGHGDSKASGSDIDFLPVTDYFLSPETADTPARWHFLTPFLPLGSLPDLAGRLRASKQRYSAHEVDAMFRPNLESLLGALHRMHTQHGLCHDDIKPDNIFIVSPQEVGSSAGSLNETSRWILADLGNVREIDHPYHESMLWSSPRLDCRASDVLRLVQSYMIFMRSSVDDVVAFDRDFWGGAQPWSWLFWQTRGKIYADGSASAMSVKKQSVQLDPTSGPFDTIVKRRHPWYASALYRLLFAEDHVTPHAVAHALRIAAPDQASRNWGLTMMLGVPVGSCRAYDTRHETAA